MVLQPISTQKVVTVKQYSTFTLHIIIHSPKYIFSFNLLQRMDLEVQYTFLWWGVGSTLAFEWDSPLFVGGSKSGSAQSSWPHPQPRKGAPTEDGLAGKPLHTYASDFSDLYFRKRPRLILSSKGEQMAYSSCLVWLTPEAIDNAGSVQVSSWAQDSWKQLCSNSSFNQRMSCTYHVLSCASEKLVSKTKPPVKFHLVKWHTSSFSFKSWL